MIAARKPGESHAAWLAKMLTGLLVIVFLFIHLLVNHLVAEGGLMDYAQVAAYLARPGIALMEGTFLVIVVVHALLGVRSVLLDLSPAAALLRWVDRFFLLVGVVSIVYGIWLMRVIIARGGAA